MSEHVNGSGDRPISDDARRILSAVQDWAQRTMPEPASGHPGPECQWCPLCQFASILRGEHPEITERIAEAGTAIAGAVRALAESAAKHTSAAPDGPADDAAKPRPGPRVQRIRLDDEG